MRETKQCFRQCSENVRQLQGFKKTGYGLFFKLRIHKQIDFTQYNENIYAANDKQLITVTANIRLV